MAGKYETKLNADRQKLKDAIKSLRDKREKTTDSKLKRRLNSQIKSKTRSLNDLNQRPAGMRTGIDPKGGLKKRIPTQPTKQAHHYGSSLNNAAAFFEDLDPPEKLLMEHAMAKVGIVPSDVTMNRLDMFTDLHQAGIHKLERDLNLEGKQYFKPGASFQEKLDAVESFAQDQRYLRQIAEEAQFKADNEVGGLSRRVEATATPEAAESYHDIERRRLAETTRDIREYAPEVHAVAGTQHAPDITGRPRLDFTSGNIKVNTVGLIGRGLARTVLPSAALGGVSLALGAGDVQAREERAEQDPSFINKFQAGLARTEQAADVAGLVPGPQTVVSEPVGLGAGLTNLAIDVARDPMGTLQAVGGGLKYLANEHLLRGAMTAP
jgi:hypothetical protein